MHSCKCHNVPPIQHNKKGKKKKKFPHAEEIKENNGWGKFNYDIL
jgi:hypothetical protein